MSKADARTWVCESGGLPLGNFSLCANFPPRALLKNPGLLGRWLQPLCKIRWKLQVNGNHYDWQELETIESKPQWPLPHIRVRIPDQPKIEVEFSAFAPVGYDDAALSSLPALCLEFRSNGAATVAIGIEIEEEYAPGICIRSDAGPCNQILLDAAQTAQKVAILALDSNDLAARR